MITTRPRVTELVFLHYVRPVHPEFFRVVATKRVRRQENALTLWVTSTGHVMTLETERQTLTEVLTASHMEMPSHPIAISKFQGFQAETLDLPSGHHLEFIYQSEVLDPKIFWDLQKEIRSNESCDSERSLIFHFGSNGRFPVGAITCLSLETRRTKIKLQAFHTFPEDFTVIRTESRVEW